MKPLRLKFFRYKYLFLSLFSSCFLLVGCGDLNYVIATNIIGGVAEDNNVKYLLKISQLFTDFPGYLADKDPKVTDLNGVLNKISSEAYVEITQEQLKSLVQDKDLKESISYRFNFNHFDSILFYINGTGAFLNCDPYVNGVNFCLGYGGAIKIKKGEEFFWFYFQDKLTDKQDQIANITKITKIKKTEK